LARGKACKDSKETESGRGAFSKSNDNLEDKEDASALFGAVFDEVLLEARFWRNSKATRSASLSKLARSIV
jgi:hypothetical protein